MIYLYIGAAIIAVIFLIGVLAHLAVSIGEAVGRLTGSEFLEVTVTMMILFGIPCFVIIALGIASTGV